jgi:hypothetical protein
MKNRDYVLQDEEEASVTFAAINVNVAKTYSAPVCFACDVRSETLRKRGFAGANIAGYYNSLGHSFGGL